MPFQDFREFLDALRAHGELIDVERPVALELEVAKAMRKSASVAGPAVVFTNNGTQFPLVGGVYNSNAKALIAYDCDQDSVFDEIVTRLKVRIPRRTSTTVPYTRTSSSAMTSTCRFCPSRDTAPTTAVPTSPRDSSSVTTPRPVSRTSATTAARSSTTRRCR